jgi:hypothetical protein
LKHQRSVLRSGKIKISLFLIIIIAAALLRTYNLEKSPPGFHRDEAFYGYNAYSILKSARDEHSRFLPLSFEGFGIWEYPMAFYLKVPFIAALGLNIFSVRISLVAISLLTIFYIYKLILGYFKDESLALIAASVSAFSTWHFFMSRTGYSIGMYGLLFLLAGTYYLFFGKSARAKVAGGVALGLTTFSYASYFFFLPVYLALIPIFYLKSIKNDPSFRKGYLIAVLTLAVAFIVFLAPNLKRGPQSAFWLNDPGIRFSWSDKPVGEILSLGGSYDVIEKWLHNPKLAIPYKAVTNYFDTFSPDFWLKTGKGFESNVQGFGNLLLYEPLLIGIGAIYLLWSKSRTGLFLLAWLFASPVTTVFTKDIASTRLLHMIVPLIIFEAVGIRFIFDRLKNLKFPGYLALLTLAIPVIFSNSLYFDAYFRHMPANASRWWYVGYFDIVDIINKYPQKTVYWKGKGDFAYIFVLFKNKYDPTKFQNEAKRELDDNNISSVVSFSRFNFVDDIDFKNLCADPNAIYITEAQTDSPPEIRNPDGEIINTGANRFTYHITSPEECSKP